MRGALAPPGAFARRQHVGRRSGVPKDQMSVPTRVRLELLGVAPLPSDLDPDEEGLTYGTALTDCRASLTTAAQRLGVRPLHRYQSDEDALWDELEEEVMRRAEDEREAEQEILSMLDERGDWHDAEDGLDTVKALIQHLEQDAAEAPVANGCRTRDVLWDLRALETILRDAQARGRRFRLSIHT